jgi:pimeloyl-ACP methyl ester carboxylesterase
VAGLLLLDPPPLSFLLGREYGNLKAMAESMTGQWQRASDLAAKSSDPETKATAAFFRMIASEHREMFGSSADQLSAVAGFGDLPLTVMASGFANPAFGPDAAGYQKYWIEQSRALSRRSTRGTFILAANSSHALHLDAPDQVAGAVLALVKAARGESGGGDVGPKGR